MNTRTLMTALCLAAAPVFVVAQAQEEPRVSQQVIAELAPTGVLRAGINLSNFLLVTGKTDNGDPVGVAPDMAREIADRLGVPVKYVTYQVAGRAGRLPPTRMPGISA